MTENCICLVDGSGYIFRAFYALPPLTKADGTPIGALFGFANMLLNLLEENKCPFLVVVFDAKRENFRNTIYPAYKENRKETPAELIPQFSLIRQLLDAFDVSWIEKEGYEADDLIATYTHRALQKNWGVQIISSDKDLMQLLQPNVSIYDPMKRKELTQQSCQEKFGVSSDKIVAVQALMGDSIDNIPGAKGIGPKTAADLINRFGTLDNLFAHLPEIEKNKVRESLKENRENVFISEKLACLKTDVPDLPSFDIFQKPVLNIPKVTTFLKENGLYKVLQRVQKNAPDVLENQTSKIQISTINSISKFKEWLQKALLTKELFLFLKESKDKKSPSQVPEQTLLCATKTGLFAEIPFSNQISSQDLFSLSDTSNLSLSDLFAVLKPILEDSSILKTGWHLKDHLHKLCPVGQTLLPTNLGDINLMSFILSGEELPLTEQENTAIFSFLLTQEKQLQEQFQSNLDAHRIYTDIEAPLIEILFQMEQTGVLVDKHQLQKLAVDFQEHLSSLTKTIYQYAGTEFNINSPSQLSKILQEQETGLTKKTASGTFKTDSKILENLAEQGNQLAKSMLEYRQIAKLKSTYVDTLLKLAEENQGRIHTTYSQTSTNTGRLSSSDPNLQNIPIRTEMGKKIRSAFIAQKGYVLVAGDYSQIELRLMASIANVPELLKAFQNNVDIHAQTASQIFGIPLQQVDADTRRQAKAINFGLIYGISAFGLAQNLGISRTKANEYIQAYFEKYPEIKTYMDQTAEQAKKNGFVKSLFGRTCFIRGFETPATAGYAMRAAINAPMQASGADIIKMAMIQVVQKLLPSFPEVRMLLQVHDELVFEVPEKQASAFSQRLKEVMEQVVITELPLQADVGIGQNWKEAH